MAKALLIKIVENSFCKVKVFEIVFKVLVILIEKPPVEMITSSHVLQSLY